MRRFWESRVFWALAAVWALAVTIAAAEPSPTPLPTEFSSKLIGKIGEYVEFHEVILPGHRDPCITLIGLMGGMAKGSSASLYCP